MARFLVLIKSLIGGQVRESGEFVELDPTASFAAANLHPLDAEAIAMRAQAEACTAESAPPGSATANELRRMMNAGRTLSEDEIQAVYSYPRKGP